MHCRKIHVSDIMTHPCTVGQNQVILRHLIIHLPQYLRPDSWLLCTSVPPVLSPDVDP